MEDITRLAHLAQRGEALEAVTASRKLARLMPEVTRRAVGRARDQGETWAAIAEAGEWPTGEAAATANRQAEPEARMARARRRRTDRFVDGLPGVGVGEAAERLGVSRGTVYAMVERGELQVELHRTPGGRELRRVVGGLPGE